MPINSLQGCVGPLSTSAHCQAVNTRNNNTIVYLHFHPLYLSLWGGGSRRAEKRTSSAAHLSLLTSLSVSPFLSRYFLNHWLRNLFVRFVSHLSSLGLGGTSSSLTPRLQAQRGFLSKYVLKLHHSRLRLRLRLRYKKGMPCWTN